VGKGSPPSGGDWALALRARGRGVGASSRVVLFLMYYAECFSNHLNMFGSGIFFWNA
jgi:hypothetical protein